MALGFDPLIHDPLIQAVTDENSECETIVAYEDGLINAVTYNASNVVSHLKYKLIGIRQ